MRACICFFQAEDGIRDLVRSRGLGDVYKRQAFRRATQHVGRFLADSHDFAVTRGNGHDRWFL